MEVSNYLVSWVVTYLGDLQPTYIRVIIYLLSTMDIPAGPFNRDNLMGNLGNYWVPIPLKKHHVGKLTLKRDYFNRKYIFQPSFFRGYVSFQGGKFCECGPL